MKKARINFRISKEKQEWLKSFAESNGQTVTAILEEFIDDLIQRFGDDRDNEKVSIRD